MSEHMDMQPSVRLIAQALTTLLKNDKATVRKIRSGEWECHLDSLYFSSVLENQMPRFIMQSRWQYIFDEEKAQAKT